MGDILKVLNEYQDKIDKYPELAEAIAQLIEDHIEVKRQHSALVDIRELLRHDLGNYLTKAQGMNFIALKNNKDSKIDYPLKRTHMALNGLIAGFGLLSLNGVSQKDLEGKAEEIEVQKTIKQIADGTLDGLERRTVKLYHPSEMENPIIYTEKHAFGTVVGNLLGNARKYSVEDTEIRGRFSMDEKNGFVFELENFIPEQMPPKELKKIFEKGHSKGSSDGHGKGEGLGLYMVRKIIENGLGGEIVAISDSNPRVQRQEGDEEMTYGQEDFFKPDLPLIYMKATIPSFKRG